MDKTDLTLLNFASLAKKQNVQRVTFVINDTDGGLDAVVAD